VVKLRELTLEDLSFLLEVRNDSSTFEFLENNSTFTLQECENWFKTSQPKWFIIEVNHHSVGYIRTNGDEVGCDIHPNYRRKGYAKMAYKAYLKDKEYASLWVFEDNFAKILYENLGFIANGNVKTIRGRNYIQMEWERKK
jgi:RimJ/RimL family protein N-acetyltransferase